MALSPAPQPFLWGSKGRRLTPDEIERERQIAAALMKPDTSPVGHWLEGAARLAGTISGKVREGRADKASVTNAAASKDNIAALLAANGLGQTATATAPMTASAAGSGVAEELAGGGSVPPASIPTTADAQQIRAGLINRGLPEHIADGFVVNFQDESGLNPGINEANPIVPGSRGGFGLYQLTGPRRKAYESFAQERGVDPADVDAQLDFLMTELQGPEKAAAERIMAAADTPMAAQAIVNHFLRPSPEHRERRSAAYAQLGSAPVEVAALNGGAGGDAAPRYVDPMVASAAPPMASPQMAAAPTQQMPPQQMAQAPAGQQFNPAILESLTSPYASETERAVAQGLLNQQLSQQQAAQQAALKEQQRAAEIARRQQIAQQTGINPAYAQDDALWEGAAGNIFAAPSTTTLGNAIIDNRTGQPIYQGEPERQPLMNLGDGTVYDPNAPQDQRFIQAPNSGGSVPDSVRALEIRAERAGLQPGTPEYNQFMISGGSGGTSLSVGPDGSVQFSQGGGRALTEAQGKDSFFAARMQSAMPTLDQYENALMSLPEAAAGALPAGRYFQSEEYQLAKDAGDDFVATYLRKDSGAALTKEERSQYGAMLLPQPGDKPAVIQAKRIRRQVAAQAIQLGLPQSAVDNMVKAVGSVEGAGEPVPTTTENPLPPQTNGSGRLRYNPATGELK